MVDYVALLKKTIDGLPNNNDDIRGRVYAKARQTVEQKLAALNPPPSEAALDKQRQALENAIEEVEQFYAPVVEEPEPVFEPEIESAFEPEPVIAPEPVLASAPEPEPDFAEEFPSEPSDSIDDLLFATSEPAGSELDDDPFEEAAATTISRAKPAIDPLGLNDPTPIPDNNSISSRAANLSQGLQADIKDNAALAGSAVGGMAARAKPKKSQKGLIITFALLLGLGGAGYAAWTQKDAINEFVAGLSAPTEMPVPAPENAPEAPLPEEVAIPETPAPTAPSNDATKFTQRLLANGEEVETGPSITEDGQSQSSQAATTPSQPLDAEADAGGTEEPDEGNVEPESAGGVAVGQTAIFYEEQTGVNAGSALRGFVVWSTGMESPADGLPPEPVIRGELSIPDKQLDVQLSIRRNADDTLPASHIIELIVETPDGFDGGGIEDVQRVTLKATEQAAGQPLIGAPVKIAEGFFLIALDNSAAALQNNTILMKSGSWLDIPVVYKTGRRALLSFEKGLPGEEIFNQAFAAWEAN